ncbi:MAG: NADH dehydrogenase (quinone) subunit D [Planctomycetes bacterium]|nr:NADH dehydrogenase (quinone) subunit D [Planctomycetota bacterium]
MVLNMGPQHPATHGTLRLVLELDGETIVRCTPEIGFLHTGFEKLGEQLSLHQFITLTDRMNYMSAMNNNVGFALACEALLGIEAPPRAQVIRVVMAELGRIADHVICVGLQAMDMGAFSVMLWCFQERERVYDIFESVCGARLTTSYTRVGGLMRDVPPGFAAEVRSFLDGLPSTAREVEEILGGNRIWEERLDRVGVIRREEALRWSLTGPIARASGVDHDLRRDRPYLGYEDYIFEVPVLEAGDCMARFHLRLAEIRQSSLIVRQALERLANTPGEVCHPDHKLGLPAKGEVHTDMESLIHHFEAVMHNRGVPVPRGEVYHATESPNGELGFYLVSQGSFYPWRVRVRAPSFINYSVFPQVAEGHLLSDAVATLSSFNVIAGELDR